MSSITYEILSGNKVKVFGLGINVEFPTDDQGVPFSTYAAAEDYAVTQIQRIEKERIGLQYAYVHVTLSGGDGRTDPIGVANDGLEKLHVVCTARQSADPSSSIVTALPDGAWRILLRVAADDSEYENITASIIDGVMTFDYQTTNPLAVLIKIDPDDMNEVFEIAGYQYGIKLVGDLEFKVYRKIGG